MVQFLPTIGKQLGFSAAVIGTIYTILPISGLLAKPLFGTLADKFRLHKTFFLIFEAILAIAFFSIYFIPEISRSATITLICDKDLPFLEICPRVEFSKKALSGVLSEVHTDAVCQVRINVYNFFHYTYFFVLVKRISIMIMFIVVLQRGISWFLRTVWQKRFYERHVRVWYRIRCVSRFTCEKLIVKSFLFINFIMKKAILL